MYFSPSDFGEYEITLLAAFPPPTVRCASLLRVDGGELFFRYGIC